MPASALPLRMLHLDALKALAAQAIVLHHLFAYGPLADAAQELVPLMADAIHRYGRMAVQVFLVVGGFLSARALAPEREPLGRAAQGVMPLLGRRYVRLAVPFFVAVLLTWGCAVAVTPWLPELGTGPVGWARLVSHALLLHGVLGHESLTVGAWYVAIDLQLFALLLGLLWCSRRLPRARVVAPVLVLAGVLGSLWVFNLNDDLDDWAPYFFGAYGLGALVHWLSASGRRRVWLAVLTALVLLALAHDFRGRIALALATALSIAWLHARHQRGTPLVRSKAVASLVDHLGSHSYALFLVHYPVCLLVNAAFDHADPVTPIGAWAALGTAWLLSNVAAVPFHRWVEAPAGRWRPCAGVQRSA